MFLTKNGQTLLFIFIFPHVIFDKLFKKSLVEFFEPSKILLLVRPNFILFLRESTILPLIPILQSLSVDLLPDTLQGEVC